MERIAVLMAGGKGRRFWPMSTDERPKQFLPIISEKSMLRETAERVLPLVSWENLYVVAVKGMEEKIKEHLPELPEENLVLEPFGRNTAACVLYSIAIIKRKKKEAVTAFLPADHYIRKEDRFREVLEAAFKMAQEKVITFGIPPEFPETGYGYIKFDKSKPSQLDSVRYYPASGFVEKPDPERARKMLEEGGYFWNSGIFVWSTKIFLQYLAKFSETFYKYYMELNRALEGEGSVEAVYSRIEELPIDKAFMEKLPEFYVVEADFGWSDVGSWRAVWEILEKDADGNAVKGKAWFSHARRNLVIARKPVAVVGLEDVVVVEAEDALLVMRKDASSLLKALVEQIVKEVKK